MFLYLTLTQTILKTLLQLQINIFIKLQVKIFQEKVFLAILFMEPEQSQTKQVILKLQWEP